MCDQRGRCGAAGARVVLHDRRLAPRRRQPAGKSPGDDIDAPAGPEWIDDPYRAVRKGRVVGHGRGGHRRLSPTQPGDTVMPPASQDRGRAPWPPGWESSKRNHRSVRGILRRRWPAMPVVQYLAPAAQLSTPRGQRQRRFAAPRRLQVAALQRYRSPLRGLSQVRRVPGAKSKQPPARLLLECLRHREADVLRFLSDTAIPPTSNQAERDLRPMDSNSGITKPRCQT